MKSNWLKTIYTVLVLSLLFVLAACGGSDDASSGEGSGEKGSGDSITLTMGHMNSTDHVQHHAMSEFAEKVEEVTEGRVKFEIYPGGALSSPAETLDSIKTGIMDSGWGLQGYSPGEFPVHSVLHLPFLANGSGKDLSIVAQKLYEEFPEIQEEYDDIVPLWFHAADPYAIVTKGKKVETLEDLKGLKLRTPSIEAGEMIESWGATQVSIPATEMYDSMQKGVIDGGVLPIAAINDFNLTDIVDYVAIGNFNTSLFYVMMNEGSWNKISPEDQEAIQELMGLPMSEVSGEKFDEQALQAREDAEALGAEFYEVSEDELNKFKEASEGIAKKWIEDMEAKGIPGQEIYDRTIELIEEQ